MSRKVMASLKIDWLSPVDRPAMEGARVVLMKRREPEADGFDKRTFTAERRRQLAESGEAMPDGSYPIVTAGDLRNAIQAFGRARNKARVAGHIKRRAKALGREDLLPEDGLLSKVETSDPDDSDRTIQLQRPAYKGHPHEEQLKKFGDEGPPVVMTSSEAGHSHLVYLGARAGETTYQNAEGSDHGHDHPWMLTASDSGTFSIEIGDSDGHSHTVDQTALNAAFAAAVLSKLYDQEDAMPTNTTTKTAEEIQQLEDSLVLARLFSSLNDSERSYFSTLEEAGKRAFVQKSQSERSDEIAKAAGNSDAVYTDAEGNVFTKADDPRLVAAVKRADESAKETRKARDELEQERLEKRAEVELPHLPGTPAVKAAVMKSIESIKDPKVRDLALRAVKAGDAAISKGFDTLGTSEVEEELGLESSGGDTAQKRFDKGVAEYAKDHQLEIPEATAKFAKTPKGRALYREIVN